MNIRHLLSLWSVSGCPGIKSSNTPKKINAPNNSWVYSRYRALEYMLHYLVLPHIQLQKPVVIINCSFTDYKIGPTMELNCAYKNVNVWSSCMVKNWTFTCFWISIMLFLQLFNRSVSGYLCQFIFEVELSYSHCPVSSFMSTGIFETWFSYVTKADLKLKILGQPSQHWS